ncbi:MFS transporter [Virgisporangium aurantiacum]|uniref:MFS transporter n=1 Tax=Virgisporangium aurantiacum TaxID=175570 RepID=A0A8J4DZE6_9ACTN|nr:MFS transporter [Virgisporangium aurantiacum]GIJ55646.1 MFS transporter [Virgisporangium aurantiacum]
MITQPTARLFRSGTKTLAYVAFFSIALPDTLLGVAWPQVHVSLGVSVAALGVLAPVGVLATLLSSASAGYLLRLIGIGALLTVSTGVSAAAVLVLGTAQHFLAVVIAIAMLGIGFGAIDTALNAFAARNFNARAINWMHAAYGLGGVVGPLLVTSVPGLGWRSAYVVVGFTLAALAVAFAVTSPRWAGAEPAATRGGAGPRPRIGAGGALARSIAVFVLEGGMEAATGLWGFVYLTSGRGVPTGVAGAAVAGYWMCSYLGRLAVGLFADRVGPRRVLAWCFAALVPACLVFALPGPGAVTVAALILIGLALAPVFPLLTLTTVDRFPARYVERMVGIQVAAKTAGVAVVPAGVALFVGRFGPAVVGVCLLAVTASCSLMYWWLTRVPPPVPEPAPSPAAAPPRGASSDP